MHITVLFSLLLAILASALPGIMFHDEPHHTHEVLQNIHETPHCAYTCIFDETYPTRFAPECENLEGKELGACLCLANAHRYMVDQCIGVKCSKDEREKVSTCMNEN